MPFYHSTILCVYVFVFLSDRFNEHAHNHTYGVEHVCIIRIKQNGGKVVKISSIEYCCLNDFNDFSIYLLFLFINECNYCIHDSIQSINRSIIEWFLIRLLILCVHCRLIRSILPGSEMWGLFHFGPKLNYFKIVKRFHSFISFW